MRITRVCAAIIKEDTVLMVQHKEKNRTYWTFPGGAVDFGENPEEAVLREVKEETGLCCRIIRPLFDEQLTSDEAICRCFLVERTNKEDPVLGYDPEELHLSTEEKMLKDISWKNIEENKKDKQIEQLIIELKRK